MKEVEHDDDEKAGSDDQEVGIYLRNTACGYPAINGGGEIRTHDLLVREIGQYNLPAR